MLKINQDNLPAISSDRLGGALEIEDLIPLEIGVEAAKNYLKEIKATNANKLPNTEGIKDHLNKNDNILETIQQGVDAAKIDSVLTKVSFARHVVEVYEKVQDEDDGASRVMTENFLELFRRLGKLQREADRERKINSLTNRIGQERKSFLKRLKPTTTRGDVLVFLENIEHLLDRDVEGTTILMELRRIERDFDLVEANKPVGDDLACLKERISKLQYVEKHETQSNT